MNKKNILVISSYASQYHQLGFFGYLNSEKIEPDCSLIIPTGSQVDNQENRNIYENRLKSHTIIPDFDSLDKEISKIKTNSEIYVICTSSNPYRITYSLRKRNMHYRLVVIEEGIGSYSNELGFIKAKIREHQKKGVQKFVFPITEFLREIYKKIIFFNKEKIYWYNYDRKNLSVNWDVVDAYRNELNYLANNNKDLVNRLKVELRDSVVLVTSPFCELNLISKENYIEKIKFEIGSKKNVFVKPHPMEDIKKYEDAGFSIIRERIPIELVINAINGSAELYGFSSTSCYTSHLFFGAKFKRLSAIDLIYNKLGYNQKKIIDQSTSIL